MYLIQILLPVFDNSGQPYDSATFERIASDLTARFGGLTSYRRAPAEGRWKTGGATKHDEIVVMEVMTPQFDRAWWKSFRESLEDRLQQEELLIRAQRVEIV
jgi:hypothetical protein